MKNEDKKPIYWSLFTFYEWRMYLAATEKGLCFIGSLNKPFEEIVQWSEKHFPGCPLLEEHERLKPYRLQLKEYLAGKRTQFSLPLDYHGTEFQRLVWQALCDIPFGETRSYSDIARSIDKPSAVRAVGGAIGKNPLMIIVPCHRVIGKNGVLTGFRGGLEMKKKLLALEGCSYNQ